MTSIELRNLDSIFYQILGLFINIDSKRAEYVRYYECLRNEMIDGLSKDANFKMIFNGLDLEGSYRDNVRVGKPNEFDLVIILNLGKCFDLVAEPTEESPGFIKVQCLRPKKECQHFQKMVTEDEYLQRNLLQQWLQSAITKILNTINNEVICKNEDGEEQVFNLKYQTLGPAHTLTMMIDKDKSLLSVDFVPGIVIPEFNGATDPEKPYSTLMAIPKMYNSKSNNHSKDVLFRRSHFRDEQKYIKGRNQLKNALRILKKFRDTHPNMAQMKSYYIKTLFLWKSQQTNEVYWNAPLSIIVYEMLTEMEQSLRNKRLPFFWDAQANLYQHLTDHHLLNMLRFVERKRKLLSKGFHKEVCKDSTETCTVVDNAVQSQRLKLEPKQLTNEDCESLYYIFLSREEVEQIKQPGMVKDCDLCEEEENKSHTFESSWPKSEHLVCNREDLQKLLYKDPLVSEDKIAKIQFVAEGFHENPNPISLQFTIRLNLRNYFC